MCIRDSIYTADPNSRTYAKDVASTALTMPSVQAALPGIQKRLDKSNAGVAGVVTDATKGWLPSFNSYGLGGLASGAQSLANRVTGGDVGGINAKLRTETQLQAREELLQSMPWLKDKPQVADAVFKELVAQGGLNAKYL